MFIKKAQSPDVVADSIAAFNQRDPHRLASLVDPEVRVAIRAVASIDATNNQHLWRSVGLRGREELRSYLSDLFLALPSLMFTTEEIQGLPCWVTLVADISGVDAQGLPFQSVVRARIRSRGDLVRSMNIDVLHLAVGHDLLSDPDGDPRRFFRHFLGELREGSAEPGAA
jgi:hypothetical protein